MIKLILNLWIVSIGLIIAKLAQWVDLPWWQVMAPAIISTVAYCVIVITAISVVLVLNRKK